MSDAESDTDRQPEPDTPGEWLDSRGAMLRLGIAERTLHRRIASGKLRKRFRQNGQIEVWVPVTGAHPPAGDGLPLSDAESDTDRQAQAERALALVERVGLAVNQQVAPLLELVERQQAIIREQAEEIGRLRASLPSPVTESDSVRQHWWQRWFGL